MEIFGLFEVGWMSGFWSMEYGMGMYGTLQRLVGSLARIVRLLSREVAKEEARTSKSTGFGTKG